VRNLARCGTVHGRPESVFTITGIRNYATTTVARLVDIANKVALTVDRTTLLRVVNG
jgi:hypothetical protein